MNNNKIQQFEDDMRQLYRHPVLLRRALSAVETREFYSSLWDVHVKPVIEHGKQLAEKYDADLEIVWLSSILHDIARLDDVENHDEVGSEKAYKILLEKGFDENVAKRVRETILTHSCKQYIPETIEQRVVASADAMSHFLAPFYLWMGKYSDKNFEELQKKNLQRVEHDYNKIFFEDERTVIKPQYEMLKRWFSYERRSIS